MARLSYNRIDGSRRDYKLFVVLKRRKAFVLSTVGNSKMHLHYFEMFVTIFSTEGEMGIQFMILLK